MYTRYHFLLDLMLTAVLGGVLRVVYLAVTGDVMAWWLCFLIAAVVVFLGTFIWVSRDDGPSYGSSGVRSGSGSFWDDLFS